MELVAKAAVDGKLTVDLKGIYARNPADKSKRIPYWIDYTKFCVNDKVIFDTLTPAWHDKPYSCDMKVEAGQEIKIQVQWLPHRSDV